MNQEDFERYWTKYYPLVGFIAKKRSEEVGKAKKQMETFVRGMLGFVLRER